MTLEQEIADWLERYSASLNLHDAAGRRALLSAAGLSDLQNACEFGGATAVFCRNLTQRLWQHGTLSDGRDPLIALMETAAAQVGREGRAECAALIDRLRHAERDTVPFVNEARRMRRNRLALSLAIPISLFGIAVGYHLLTRTNHPVNQFTTNSGAISVAQDHGTAIQNNYGVPPELFAEYVKKLALTESLVAKFLESLQEQKIPREQWEEKLQEIAEQYKELVQRLELIKSEDPQVVELKTQARQAIEDGQFDAAESLLKQAESPDFEAIEQLKKNIQEQQAALEKRQISLAETKADNARLQEVRLRYAKAAEYWRQAAELLPESEQKTRSLYLSNAGYDFHRVARYADALPLFEQSLVIRREIGDKAGEGTTLNNLSQIYDARGDYATALTYLEQSLAISREIGDKAGEGTTLNNIGQIYKARGDYATALTYLEQSLAISREIGDKAGEWTTRSNIGGIYWAQGDYSTTLTYLEQSLAISREIGDKAGEGTTLNNIGQTYQAWGDYATAQTYLEQSLAISREIGDKAGEGTTLNNIGLICQARGDYATALTHLEQCLTIFREIGNKAHEGGTLNNISQIYQARGDYATALTYLEQCLTIFRQTDSKSEEGVTCWNIGQIYKKQGNLAKAEEYIRRTVQIDEEIGHPDLEKDRAALEKIRKALQQGQASGGAETPAAAPRQDARE